MTPMIHAERFLATLPTSAVLPLGEDGEPDADRVDAALRQATGVIVTHLPWLPDEHGEIARPVGAQFAAAPEAICADLALDRLTDTATGSENTRNRYRESLALLEKINREYRGGLEGPGFQESEVVVSGGDGIPDGRFFRKGGLFWWRRR